LPVKNDRHAQSHENLRYLRLSLLLEINPQPSTGSHMDLSQVVSQLVAASAQVHLRATLEGEMGRGLESKMSAHDSSYQAVSERTPHQVLSHDDR